MTAVMRPADARLAASIMMSISITWSFTGTENDCTRKTSRWRTFSLMRTKVLSLLNLNASNSLSGIPR